MEEVHELELFSLTPPVSKPGGGEFKFWKNETSFTRTYHVDVAAAKASDDNPGTESHPFKTIGRAAVVLQPAERVLVHPGLYRECIRPATGGLSPSLMIGFHAVPGGQVIIRGSEVVGRNWRAEGPSEGVWVLDLGSVSFSDYNPFALDNLPEESFAIMDWAQPHRGKLPYTLPRGMVFQDGRRLQCATSREELGRIEGSHWTDRAARQLHVYTFGRKDPNGCLLEVTTRRAGLRPIVRGLGFINVRGFIFEHIGNGFSRPQDGAISVCSGNHWLIEDNTIREVNGIGIDIGNGWYGGAVNPPEAGGGEPEWNIVRRNTILETGVCGIAGLPCKNALIEENILRNNSRFPIAEVSESAGIKTHVNQGTLIRRNIIMDNPINGIWMDWDNRNSRCTQNVMLNCGTGIFIEASVVEPFCVIDRNIVWGAKQCIYEHDCTSQTFIHNLFGQSDVGIVLSGRVTDRIIVENHPAAGGGHLVANNLFVEVGDEVKETTKPEFPQNKFSGNAFAAQGVSGSIDLQRQTVKLTASKSISEFCDATLVTHDLLDRPWPHGDRSPGPIPIPGIEPVETNFSVDHARVDRGHGNAPSQ